MQIAISDDMQTANVNGHQLKVGGPVSFRNSEGKIVPGIILEFRYVAPSKFGKDAPWCYAKDIKSNNANWFALVNWTPPANAVQQQAPAPAPAPIPQPANIESTDDDCI